MPAPDPADVAEFRKQLRDLGLHAEADNPAVILAFAGTAVRIRQQAAAQERERQSRETTDHQKRYAYCPTCGGDMLTDGALSAKTAREAERERILSTPVSGHGCTIRHFAGHGSITGTSPEFARGYNTAMREVAALIGDSQ